MTQRNDDRLADGSGREEQSNPGGASDLSVIIAVRNGAETIAQQLDAIVGQTWGGSWDVIVADNGSTDGTQDIVRQYRARYPFVRLVDASAERGAGPARNRAMELATASAFAFCDADDIVELGWVSAMGSALQAHEFVAGPLRFDQLNPSWLETAFYAHAPTALETFEGIFPFGATCNLGVSRAAIERVGGFDPTFLAGQDLELCLRLWAAGVELTFVPDAVVQYRYRPTMASLFRRSRQYGAVGPRIAHRLAVLGVPTPPRYAGLRQWLWLARHLGRLRSPAGRARWLVVAGRKIGRVEGSIRERWVYL